jgi:hypothetical protein
MAKPRASQIIVISRIMTTNIAQMSDEALASETKQAAHSERLATERLLALLIEVERRGLHLALGYSSMFVYCTRALHLSEQAAYSRITAARAAKRFPKLLGLLADGALTLSSVGLLAPHLTDETLDPLLDAAKHKSTRDVERLIANAHPQPDIPTQIRALPTVAGKQDESKQNRPSGLPLMAVPAVPAERKPPRVVVAPIAPTRYLLKLTISEDTHGKWQRARDLMRHAIPDGDADQILNRALTVLLDHVGRSKLAAVDRPRQAASTMPSGRHIPAAVRRTVWQRDQGRCAFVGSDGPCSEAGFLEFHHVVPFAAGGATDSDNLQLRCHAHNAYEATVFFGEQSAVHPR